ncbi:MAG: 50S ribosomal protein L37ae [Candidatus Pacearchaeota archaeon]
MGKTKKVKSAARFRAGLGVSVRRRIVEIEQMQKKKQECPFCLKKAAKRQAYGIFLCKACGKKFAAKAYLVK